MLSNSSVGSRIPLLNFPFLRMNYLSSAVSIETLLVFIRVVRAAVPAFFCRGQPAPAYGGTLLGVNFVSAEVLYP